MNDTSDNRTYQQLPDNVPGFDIVGNVFVNQPVRVSPSWPGSQVVKVTGSVDRISIQPIGGQILIIDALTSVKTVIVQTTRADVAASAGAVVATIPAGGYGLLISSAAGWYFTPSSSAFSEAITVPISGGDDWPTAVSLAAQAAALGVPLRFGPGTYKAQSRQAFPSKLTIIMTPQTKIAATITPTNNLDSVFSTGPGVSLATTTLTAQPALSQSTIQVAAAICGTAAVPPPHTYITIIDSGNAFRVATYRVVSTSAAGLTLNLDHSLEMAAPLNTSLTSFPNGSVVELYTPTRDLFIYGNGARIEGLCNRYIEFIRCWNCHAYDLDCGPDANGANALERGTSIDSPSYNCSMTNVNVDCSGTVATILGHSFEATQNSHYYRCKSILASATNMIFQDAINCATHDCVFERAAGGGINVLFTAASPGVIGSYGCRVMGGTISNGNLHGVGFNSGSSKCGVYNTVIDGHVGDGVVVLSGAWTCYDCAVGSTTIRKNGASGVELTTSANRFRVDACDIVDNATGLAVPTGVVGVVMTNLDLSGNVTPVNTACADFSIDGLYCKPAANHNPLLFLTSGADLRLNNATLVPTDANVTANTVQAGAGARLRLSNSTSTGFAGGGSALVAVGVAAVIECSNVTCLQTGAGGQGAFATAAGTIRLGNNFNASACTTPFSAAGGGFLSIFTIVAAGTGAAQDITFPQARTTDVVDFQLVTLGGVSTTKLVATTAGTKFTVTFPAADTSTYTGSIRAAG